MGTVVDYVEQYQLQHFIAHNSSLILEFNSLCKTQLSGFPGRSIYYNI